MGGVGITFSSTEEGQTSQQQSTPLTNLSEKVVDEIATVLGIQTSETKQALMTGKIDLPDNVEVTITRKSTKQSLTLKKLPGVAQQFELTFEGKTRRISAR